MVSVLRPFRKACSKRAAAEEKSGLAFRAGKCRASRAPPMARWPAVKRLWLAIALSGLAGVSMRMIPSRSLYRLGLTGSYFFVDNQLWGDDNRSSPHPTKGDDL